MGTVSDIRAVCFRCSRAHSPVSFPEWWAAFRENPETRSAVGGHVKVLLMITRRLSDETGCGFASLRSIAEDSGSSESTVQRALRWARDKGFLILALKGRAFEFGLGLANEWRLAIPSRPVTDDALSPAETPAFTVTGDYTNQPSTEVKDTEADASALEGDSTMARTASKPAQDALFLVPEAPPREDTQTLVAEWIAHCPTPPPARVRGQVCRLIKEMLDEGIDYRHVRAGLARWHQRALNPSVLPSCVNQVMNGGPTDEVKAQFTQFWDAYPRRAKPQDALYWFRRVLADGTSFETVMLGVKKLLAALDAGLVEARYLLNPDSWLRAGSWDDEYARADAGYTTQAAYL